jgi:hypothetical protein
MAENQGLATFLGGTGIKTTSIGITATWMNIEIAGTGLKHMRGFISGGNQHVFPDNDSAITAGKAIQLRDSSGAVILEGTWTGFASGNATFNITTAPATMPQMFLRFGN